MAKSSRKTIGQKSLFGGAAPKMPDGYYSGDKPNPNLHAFVEGHLRERPYDPATDKYEVPAFNKPIETTKATAIYNMHTYWSKKPHDAIREYIRHYTQPGDLVLDPFCGSGGTALAALMEGRHAIAIDRSPAATFITKNYCTPVDPDELRDAFEQVRAKVKDKIDWLYETRCDRCGGKATTEYTVYSQVFQCPRCLEKMPLFDCDEVDGETAAGKPKKINVCPHCHKRGHEEEISTRTTRFGSIPVLVSYVCESGCKPARGERRHDDAGKKKREYFQQYDLGKLKEIDQKEIPHWYPPHRMMNVESDTASWGDKWRAGSSNFRKVAELFTKRNLWALAAIFDAASHVKNADAADAIRFSLTGVLLGLSRMNRFVPNASFPFYLLMGTYYVPQIACIEPVWKHFANKADRVAKGFAAIRAELSDATALMSTQSSTDLSACPSNSMDYIFSDPPYAEKVQYGELNFVWEAWLNVDTRWHDEEIIVNSTRGRTEADWTEMMKRAMAECYRVLKPGRWISLCYHDTSEGTWALLQDVMAEAGFVADIGSQATFIDTEQKSFNQITADKVNKRDLVINFRKPKPGEFRITRVMIPENADVKTFRELARQVVRDCLTSNPGSTKDRVYDELVSRMVRAGQMQAHNFDEILREVAEDTKDAGGAARWYLRESEESALDAAESAKEDAAAEAMAKFIQKTTAKTYDAGVHYSDLFEHYLYSVKDKPRRPLADWLPDYLYKTEDGTWRLPASQEEQELKTKARVSGTNRRVKRFASMLEAGVAIPAKKVPTSASLAEWIRHAKRAGLYEVGKLLYERGGLDMDRLSEQVQAEVEEDYQVCVRALQRAAGGSVDSEGKRGRRKKDQSDE